MTKFREVLPDAPQAVPGDRDAAFSKWWMQWSEQATRGIPPRYAAHAAWMAKPSDQAGDRDATEPEMVECPNDDCFRGQVEDDTRPNHYGRGECAWIHCPCCDGETEVTKAKAAEWKSKRAAPTDQDTGKPQAVEHPSVDAQWLVNRCDEGRRGPFHRTADALNLIRSQALASIAENQRIKNRAEDRSKTPKGDEAK